MGARSVIEFNPQTLSAPCSS